MFRSIRTLRSISRLKDIAFVLGRHGFHQVAGRLHAPFSSRLSRLFNREPGHVVQQPERLRMVLEDLGPTFIKFGQLLSTRPDLLPPVYLEELEKLQDEVPPEPFSEIRSILDAEFRGRVDELFESIDPKPLAAASIAQVHRAVTRSGDEVVIKVRKRGLQRVIEQDLLVLELLTDFLGGWSGFRLFDPEGVLRVFERSIRRELDFNYERQNLARLRENSPEGSPVCFPSPIAELSTEAVLTMEFLRGEKLSSLSHEPLGRERGEEVARAITSCFLRQIFEDGLFHADAHPGNIILMDDGRVGLIDVGNVGRLTPEMIDELVALLAALARQDYRALSRWILRQGRPAGDIDAQGLAMDLMDQLDPYYGLKLEEIRLGPLFNALFAIALRYGIRVPPQYVTVGRTFLLVEGSVRLTSPRFDFLPLLRPYVTDVLRRRWRPGRVAKEIETQIQELVASLRTVPANLTEVLARTAEGRLRLESVNPDLVRIERKLDVLARKVPIAMIVASLIISSAALLCFGGGSDWAQILGVTGIGVSALLGARLVLGS